MDAQPAVLHPHPVDRAGDAAASAADARALKGRARRRGGDVQPPAVPQGDLAIGAHVAQEGRFLPVQHAAGQQRAGRVRAHKGMQAGRQAAAPSQQLRLEAEEAVRLEGRAGQAGRVAPGEQAEHRRVAGDDQRSHLLRGTVRLGAGVAEQGEDGGFHGGLQRRKAALHRRVDAADHVGSHGGLRVQHGRDGQAFAAGQVVQAQRQGGGADIDRRAEAPWHGPHRRNHRAAASLDLRRQRLRQDHHRVAMDHRLAGKARPAADFRSIGRGSISREQHGALAAHAPASAGLRQRLPRLRQQRGELLRMGKSHRERLMPAMDGQCGHVDPSRQKSTMPKKVTVFCPLMYFRSVGFVVLYTSMP